MSKLAREHFSTFTQARINFYRIDRNAFHKIKQELKYDTEDFAMFLKNHTIVFNKMFESYIKTCYFQQIKCHTEIVENHDNFRKCYFK